jgi:tetratricopeptide (TPR) repeat protein
VPLNAEDYFKLATDHYYKGRYEEALKALEKAIELKPDLARAWY